MIGFASILLWTLWISSSAMAAEEEGIRFLLEDKTHEENSSDEEERKESVELSVRVEQPVQVEQKPAAPKIEIPVQAAAHSPELMGVEVERRKLEAGFLGGVMANSYHLSTSSGYSIKLPPAIGPFLGIHVLYSPRGSTQYFLELWEERRKFKTITGITPGPLEVKDRVATVGFRTPTSKRFFLEPFYRWQMKLVDEIRPIAVMTASQLHGLGLRVGVEREKENFWRNTIHLGAFSPIFYKERFQRTGNSRLRLSFELQNRFRYFLKNNFYLGVGLQFQADVYSHSGRGDRSISDSRERWLKLAIPLEIGRRF